MDVDKEVFLQYLSIVSFLDECVQNGWELDTDDIRHIIKRDFDHVRKQYKEVMIR